MNLVANEIYLHACAIKGWNSTYIHVLVGELWKYSCAMGYPWTSFMYCYMNSFIILEYTKAVTLHCAKVRGGKDQGPATQVTHLR